MNRISKHSTTMLHASHLQTYEQQRTGMFGNTGQDPSNAEQSVHTRMYRRSAPSTHSSLHKQATNKRVIVQMCAFTIDKQCSPQRSHALDTNTTESIQMRPRSGCTDEAPCPPITLSFVEDQVYRKMEDDSKVFQRISPISKLHGISICPKKDAVIWGDHFQETCILEHPGTGLETLDLEK